MGKNSVTGYIVAQKLLELSRLDIEQTHLDLRFLPERKPEVAEI